MTQAVLAREVDVLPQDGVTGGLVPFPGQFFHLQKILGPSHQPLGFAGVYLDFTGTLLAAAVCALVCAQCFVKVNEP